MVLNAGNILLVGAVLLFVSILAGKAGSKFGVPVLLLFLGVGMVFGSDGLGIQFNSPTIAQFIGMIALSVILFSGGMDTKFKEIRPVLGPGIILATLGVMITTAITGGIIFLVTRYFFGSITLTLYESLLLAAVISSTDSASVFSILRSKGLRLKENLRPMLEFESGSNDPMANILTILFIQVIQVGHMSFGHSAGVLLMQIGVGAVAGYVLGRISLFFVNRLDVDNQSQYPILLLALVFFIFSFTDLIGGNGYLAVYLAGLVIGNSKMPHHRSTTTFFDGIAWLAQLVMFLTLGLLVNPTELLPVAGIGLLIAVAMIVIALVLIAFCIVQLIRVADVAALVPDIGTLGLYLYGTALVCGIALVPPAIIAIYVAKHPARVTLAIAMAIIALALVVAFFGYAMVVTPQYVVTALLYALLLAVLPVVYLVAALKIKRSL